MDRRQLLAWYRDDRRDLPWRRTRDPYAIWVSEAMCQQTRVAVAVPYFERWMARFPTVAALTAADEREVLGHWAGLGYYRRCRDLLAAARIVARDGFPSDAAGWRRLPGIGRYMAGAIASIALGERVPAVDGNVERIFARFTGCERHGSALNRAAWQWAQRYLDHEGPGEWNQALMELGALVCTPRDPNCRACPLAPTCNARLEGRQSELPRRVPKPSKVEIELFVCAPIRAGRVGLRRSPAGGWWAGLWEFPTERSLGALAWVAGERRPLPPFRHVVTRHRLTIRAMRVDCPRTIEGLDWPTLSEASAFPLSAPQLRVLRMLAASVVDSA